MSKPSKVKGHAVLRMRDGTTHRFPNRKILRLISDVRVAIGPPPAVIPEKVFVKHPKLVWFRDCVSARSSDGCSLYQLVSLTLFDDPAAAADQSESDEGRRLWSWGPDGIVRRNRARPAVPQAACGPATALPLRADACETSVEWLAVRLATVPEQTNRANRAASARKGASVILAEMTGNTAENGTQSSCTVLILEHQTVQRQEMPTYVAYYRVSTDRQGASGLGLDAQREAVKRFIGAAELLAEFTEVESGKRHTNRPQLAAALAECKKRKATLVIAKLDRLARNVHFISGLMESKVDFVAVDFPQANKLTIHILAAVAEHERELISQRTAAAFAQIKRELAEKGSRISHAGRVYTKLGNPRLQEARAKASAANRTPPPANTIRFIQEMREKKLPLRKIVEQLNNLNIRTGRGSVWYASTVRALLVQQQRGA